MESKIISRITTKEEQNAVIEELVLLQSTLYKKDKGTFEECLDKSVRSWVAVIIKDELHAGNIPLETYLRELLEAVKDLRLINVYLGQDPSNKILLEISNWIEKHMGAGWIADIEVHKDLLGGARIVIDGHYYDGTLASQIEKTWLESGKEILKQAAIYG